MPKINMVEIDPKKLDKFLEGKNLSEIDDNIGKAHGYMRLLRNRLKMTVASYRLLCRIYNLPEDALTPDPPKPEPPAVPPKPNNRRAGYWLDLADNSNHVVLRLMYGDEEVYLARARVKNGETATELNFIQAVSYAAHMLYKLAEQYELGDS